MSVAHSTRRRPPQPIKAWPVTLLIFAASAASTSSLAGVTGSVHINSGYNQQTFGLVPNKVFNFTAPSDPALTLDYQQVFRNNAQPPQVVFYRSANAMADGSNGTL